MSKDGRSKYQKLIEWRERHIKERQLVLLLSLVVGVLSACAAALLKTLAYGIRHGLELLIGPVGSSYWYLVTPIIGIALAMLFVRYVVRDDISHGITRILFAISQRKSILKLHNTWTSIVGASLTIGFGGSVGAEAPIVLTGSAIGSQLAKFFKLNQKTMMLMIGCGAAGAIGGIFKAPIAGLVFTIEVLMIDMTASSVVPLMMSSVTACAMSYLFFGSRPMFDFTMDTTFALTRVPWLVLLGLICGLVSLYFTRGSNWAEGMFKRVQNPYVKLLIGGVMLSVLILVFPSLYGEGYDNIIDLLTHHEGGTFGTSPIAQWAGDWWVVVLYLMGIIIFKIFATTATNAAGGVGGIFAPSLFVGAMTGFMIAVLLQNLGLDPLYAPETNFALAGMAGLMSGVMHAPLTGIFLIAELTGGYDLFMTLMIVSVVSYITIMLFEPHSLYSMRLAQQKILITHHKDRAVLTLMKMDNVIETEFSVLSPEMTLGELVKVISKSNRNLFPVVDKAGRFQGWLLLDEVRNIMFRPELYERFTVRQLMTSPPALLQQDQPMEKVMEVFEDSGAWNLPVVDADRKYVGFVSKSKIFNSYRHVLMHFSEE